MTTFAEIFNPFRPKENHMSTELGCTYRDKITGFQGVCTGFVHYLTGCNQALLTPTASNDGSLREAHWFDVQRLELRNANRIALDNGPTPGFDKPAPKR